MKESELLYRIGLVLGLLAALTGCATVAPTPCPVARIYASLPLVHCSPEMDSADYWVSRLKQPDQVLLTTEEIQDINRSTYQGGLLTDIFSDTLWDFHAIEAGTPDDQNPETNANPEPAVPNNGRTIAAYTLFSYLKEETDRIKRTRRWDIQGRPFPTQAFAPWDANLNLEDIKESNPVRYGLVAQRTDIRFYPTDTVLNSQCWDTDFDILQVSSIRPLTPVVVLHASRDQAWLFVVNSFCRGWAKAKDLMVFDGPPGPLKRFSQPERRLIVTGHKAVAFAAPGNTLSARTLLYMGTVCPLVERRGSEYEVQLPGQDAAGRFQPSSGFIPVSADVQEGYLPCTPRLLLTKAFQILHTPYAWGGKGEHRDCSQFLMDLYATVGLELPRNSTGQARVGKSTYPLRYTSRSHRAALLSKLEQPALLQFPGHIMLYLGREGNYYYALHDIWSFRVPNLSDADDKVIIGKLVVSDLSLGEGSRKGSLLERVTTINLLKSQRRSLAYWQSQND